MRRVVAPWPYGVGKSVVLGPSAPSRARSHASVMGGRLAEEACILRVVEVM